MADPTVPAPEVVFTVADGIKALTTVAAAGLGAWVAAQVALNRWRAEMTGRRRAELAEEVLADFYRLRYDMIYFARHIVWAKTPEERDRIWHKNAAFVAEVEERTSSQERYVPSVGR
jgi:hypothetical protein